MKKCPNCQKTYDDNMKFCQSDGTPLVVVAEDQPSDDPYKTMVASDIKLPVETPESSPEPVAEVPEVESEADVLEIPEEPVVEKVVEDVSEEPPIDPMKTMVVTGSDTAGNIKIPDLKDESEKEVEAEVEAPEPSPEIPQFSEPDIKPPDMSDVEVVDSGSFEDAKESVLSESPMPSDSSPLPDPPAPPPNTSTPIPSPFDESMPPGMAEPETPPFQSPEEGEISVEEAASSPASPFEDVAPASPFDEPESNESASVDPFANNKIDAPIVASSGSSIESTGSSESEGENKTLAIISLVTGILSVLCCVSIFTGPAAIITGYMAKGKISAEPDAYGGGTLATVGMILGAVGIVFFVILVILQVLGSLSQF